MDSKLLGELARFDISKDNPLRDRSEAWAWVNSHRDTRLKIRINLTEEDNSDFVYCADYRHDSDEIMYDRTSAEMVDLFEEWKNQMPHLYHIITTILEDISHPNSTSDRNFLDIYSDEIEESLKDIGLYGGDLDMTLTMLLDLGRDMYNYLMHALLVDRNFYNERITEYLKCQEAWFDGNKLYMTLAIYEENLKYLEICIDEAVEMDIDEDPESYTDADFVEVTNGLRTLFAKYQVNYFARKVRNRNWDRGPTSRLLG